MRQGENTRGETNSLGGILYLNVLQVAHPQGLQNFNLRIHQDQLVSQGSPYNVTSTYLSSRADLPLLIFDLIEYEVA